MIVLIVGSGGREHALAWAIGSSPQVDRVYVAPGNGGTSRLAENVDILATDIDALASFAREKNVDLTVVGPEAPLVAGIVDRFRKEGLVCFGPTRAAARLEGSKVFAKNFMQRHAIPTGAFGVFGDAAEAKNFTKRLGAPLVVKADGLAAGKGVIVAKTMEDAHQAIDSMIVGGQFGDAGTHIVVEEFLEGDEVSAHAICSGGDLILFPFSQDHKRVGDGDRGPNTGGMGAYSPVPFVSEEDRRRIMNEVMRPTLAGMAADGVKFTGVLYAGLMMTSDGPKVLEYNVRFGDPETQVLLPMVKGDLVPALQQSATEKKLEPVEFFTDRSAATVVVAAGGYPGSYDKGIAIEGVDRVNGDDRFVFHAGTRSTSSGLVTSGGRVLAVSAWSGQLQNALERAYQGVDEINFDGAFSRRDIGHRALQ